MGLPKCYACFKDESLNQELRSVATYAHRATFPERIHKMFDIMGRLGHKWLTSQGAALPLIAWPRRRG